MIDLVYLYLGTYLPILVLP